VGVWDWPAEPDEGLGLSRQRLTMKNFMALMHAIHARLETGKPSNLNAGLRPQPSRSTQRSQREK